MKKLIFLLSALVCLSSCTFEYFDTFVEWGFAPDKKSDIVNGLETLLPSSQEIFTAFDDAFYGEYDDLGLAHEALMRTQQGHAAAEKNAVRTAKKAHSAIRQDLVCPVDYIFVVRIKYNSDSYETVWSHDYRAK